MPSVTESAEAAFTPKSLGIQKARPWMLGLLVIAVIGPLINAVLALLYGTPVFGLLLLLLGLPGPLIVGGALAWSDSQESAEYRVEQFGFRVVRRWAKAVFIPWSDLKAVRTVMFNGGLRTVLIPEWGTLWRGSPTLSYYQTNPPGQCFALLGALGNSPAGEKFDVATTALFDAYQHAKDAENVEETLDDLVHKAYRALLLGRYYHARRGLRQQADRTGSVPDDLLRLEYATGYPRALATCQEALEQNPDNSTAQYFLAGNYMRAFGGSSIFAPVGAAPFRGRVRVGMLEQAREAWLPLLDSSRYREDAKRAVQRLDELIAAQEARARS